VPGRRVFFDFFRFFLRGTPFHFPRFSLFFPMGGGGNFFFFLCFLSRKFHDAFCFFFFFFPPHHQNKNTHRRHNLGLFPPERAVEFFLFGTRRGGRRAPRTARQGESPPGLFFVSGSFFFTVFLHPGPAGAPAFQTRSQQFFPGPWARGAFSSLVGGPKTHGFIFFFRENKFFPKRPKTRHPGGQRGSSGFSFWVYFMFSRRAPHTKLFADFCLGRRPWPLFLTFHFVFPPPGLPAMGRMIISVFFSGFHPEQRNGGGGGGGRNHIGPNPSPPHPPGFFWGGGDQDVSVLGFFIFFHCKPRGPKKKIPPTPPGGPGGVFFLFQGGGPDWAPGGTVLSTPPPNLPTTRDFFFFCTFFFFLFGWFSFFHGGWRIGGGR